MAVRWEAKRPTEVRDYTHDWTAFLDGDTIATSVWVATGVTINSETETTTTATVWLSGGTSGITARLTNTIVTAGGRTEAETFTLLVSSFEEPVSLTEAKAQCRIVDDNSEDALIERLVRAARQWVENYTGHALVRRTFTEWRTGFGSYIELHNRPVVTVDEVNYTDTDGAEQEYDDPVSNLSRYPVRIYPELNGYWPSVGSYGGVTVEYTAGYAEGEVPDDLVHAVLLLISHWFEHRSAGEYQAPTEIPFGVLSLCQPYRNPGL